MGPHGMMLNHRIEDSQKFTHTSGQGEFFRLTKRAEPLVKGANDWITAGGDQSCHVKRTHNLPTSAPDYAFTSHQSTISVKGGHPHQSRYLMPIKLSQFRN